MTKIEKQLLLPHLTSELLWYLLSGQNPTDLFARPHSALRSESFTAVKKTSQNFQMWSTIITFHRCRELTLQLANFRPGGQRRKAAASRPCARNCQDHSRERPLLTEQSYLIREEGTVRGKLGSGITSNTLQPEHSMDEFVEVMTKRINA